LQVITADIIHDGYKFLPPGSSIVLSEDGKIHDIIAQVPPHAIKYSGLLCPGFINAHCHLELSYMLGEIAQGTGLAGFITEVGSKRVNTPLELIKLAIETADEVMYNNGIVAVADICNSTATIDTKLKKQNILS
jgi:aminodeoxyfutalosine deaminase